MMGPSHALSSAAAALGALAIYSVNVAPVHPTVAIMATAVAAGAALAPDIDSHNSTVVNSFGIFGKLAHQLVNALSVAVYNTTKTRRDEHKEGGHRTLFHTTVMAIVMGVLVSLATLPTNIIEVLGREYTLGQFNAIIILAIFINLSFAGLFEKFIKKMRRQFGPYVLMAVSLGLAFVVAMFAPLPEDSSFGLSFFGLGGSYAYLGIAVTFGWMMHLLGDAITKMGVPMIWPFKFKGKRWWDVSLPAFLRITAGGTLEKVVLFPLFLVSTIGLLCYNVILYLT